MNMQIANLPYESPPKEDAAPRPFSLLSDAGGEITEMAVRIVGPMLDDPPMWNASDNLFKALAKGNMSFVVVTGDILVAKVETYLNGAGLTGRCRICPVPNDELNHSNAWPRDCMLCGTRPHDSPMAVVPTISEMSDNNVNDLAGWLTSFRPLPAIAMNEVHMDGGDCLVVDNTCWMVGAHSVNRTMSANNVDWDQAVKILTDANGGRVPVVAGYNTNDLSLRDRWTLTKRHVRERARRSAGYGSARSGFSRLADVATHFFALAEFVRNLIVQPQMDEATYHADMAISVTGRRRNGRPLILVGDPTLCAPKNIPPASLRYYSSELDAMKNALDKTAEWLQSQGFEVLRNSTPLLPSIGTPVPTRLAYNNVIVQTDPDVVWLPIFTTDDLDARESDNANIATWCGLGFKVIPVPGAGGFLESAGVIRCATLALTRKPSSRASQKSCSGHVDDTDVTRVSSAA